MYYRSFISSIESRLREPKRWIQVLMGPRQVGKTTGVNQLLDRVRGQLSSHFCALDDPDLHNALWFEQQWNRARELARTESKALLVVDEVQKLPNWSESVKRLWDEDTRTKTELQVILLGSSAMLMQEGLTESLAGRFESTWVDHWSYQEMKDAFGYTLDEWIYHGGYPGPAEIRKDHSRWRSYILDSLVESSVTRDVLMMNNVHKPALLRRLFHLGCAYSAQEMSLQKMLGQLQDAGNATTLSHYLELLSRAGLLSGLQKYSESEVRQKASSPKLQVHNNALLTVTSSLSLEAVKAQPDVWGRRVESAVGAHLMMGYQVGRYEMNYWREGDHEVDFVIHRDGQVLGIEVKSGSNRGGRVSGLEMFKKRFKKAKVLLIGPGTGIPIEEFVSRSAVSYFS